MKTEFAGNTSRMRVARQWRAKAPARKARTGALPPSGLEQPSGAAARPERYTFGQRVAMTKVAGGNTP